MNTSPIFLVGCPRSGTTLLQSLIATHSQVASFPETKFFQYLDACYEPKRQFLGLISKRLPPRLQIYFCQELQRPEFLDRFPRIPLANLYVRCFLSIMQDLVHEQNKSRFLEKTPEHIYHLACIERWLPRAPVLHLIRDGADVVASLYEVTRKLPKLFAGSRPIETCIDNWLLAVAQSRKCIGKSNHAFVNYAKLTERPEEVLQKICTFLNLSYEIEMLTEYSVTSQKIQLTSEIHKRATGEAIVTKSRHKFRQIFTPDQQNYILKQIFQEPLEQFPFL